MAMNFREIYFALRSDEDVCADFRPRLLKTGTKDEVIHMLTDVNGAEYMTMRVSTDIDADYADLERTLSRHINGNRIIEHEDYTSEMYINAKGVSLSALTTLLVLWGCDVAVTVPENARVLILCDRNTRLSVTAMTDSSVVCACWGKGPRVTGDGKVRYKKLKKD